MRIALFASDAVGLEIAKTFSQYETRLACLVLDSRDLHSLNEDIVCASSVEHDKIFFSDDLYSEATIRCLRRQNLDLIILAWWPYIIKDSIRSIPRLGCLNFHPSYLPYNRGKNYNFWALLEESPFGVTIHWVDSGIDTGDIAFQSSIETSWEDTGATLYRRAREEIVLLFKAKYEEIMTGRIPRIPQNRDCGSFHYSKELDEASRIDLNKTYEARNLLNILRGRSFRPHPGAWFVDNGVRYKVRIDIERVGEEVKTRKE